MCIVFINIRIESNGEIFKSNKLDRNNIKNGIRINESMFVDTNTSTIDDVEYMFLDDTNTSTTNDIEYMFLDDANTSTIDNEEYMFLDDDDTSSTNNREYMFLGDNTVEKIDRVLHGGQRGLKLKSNTIYMNESMEKLSKSELLQIISKQSKDVEKLTKQVKQLIDVM